MSSVAEITTALEVPDRDAGEMRSKIVALEQHILTLPQVDLPIQHHFSTKIYMREMFIPKGTVLTGAVHKHEHLNILSKGVLSVWTENGMKKLTASAVIKSQPGIKRVGFAHEDSIWITVHHNPDEEREPEKLWDMCVANTYEEFLEFAAKQELLATTLEPKLIEQEGEK